MTLRIGSDTGSTPVTSIMGVPRVRRVVTIVTGACLDKETIDAKTSTPAANNIVAFSRPVAPVRTRELVAA